MASKRGHNPAPEAPSGGPRAAGAPSLSPSLLGTPVGRGGVGKNRDSKALGPKSLAGKQSKACTGKQSILGPRPCMVYRPTGMRFLFLHNKPLRP
jgi:hypothetical protein